MTLLMWLTTPEAGHAPWSCQISYRPIALLPSPQQNRMAVAEAPGLTSRDAKLGLNYILAL